MEGYLFRVVLENARSLALHFQGRPERGNLPKSTYEATIAFSITGTPRVWKIRVDLILDFQISINAEPETAWDTHSCPVRPAIEQHMPPVLSRMPLRRSENHGSGRLGARSSACLILHCLRMPATTLHPPSVWIGSWATSDQQLGNVGVQPGHDLAGSAKADVTWRAPQKVREPLKHVRVTPDQARRLSPKRLLLRRHCPRAAN